MNTLGHVQNRLDVRGLPYTAEQLQGIARQYSQDTAVILGKIQSQEDPKLSPDVIILIVRNSRPITIMTRRQSQNFDKRNFNVQKIVYQ